MRLLVALAIVALSFPGAAAPARAGECFGMLDYTYEAGECHDTTGDTTDLLIAAGKESEQLQQGMIERSRSVSVGGSGYAHAAARGVDERVYQRVGSTMLVRYAGPTIVPQVLLSRIRASDPKKYAQLLRYFNAQIATYDRSAVFQTHYVGWNYLPGARAFFLEAAYVVFDGETLSDEQRTLLMRALLSKMIYAPLAGQSEAVREAVREDYIIRGFTFIDAAQYFARHHRRADLARLRRQVRASLALDLTVDPQTLRISDIFCNIMTTRAVSCEMQRRFFLGHS